MIKPKKLSPEQRRLSDRCKERISHLKATPTDILLKQAAMYKEDLGV